MSDHDIEACRAFVVEQAATLGLEIVVSTASPLTPSPYSYEAMVCPHGTRFYMQPTNDQIIRWREAGVR
jgi:hypothetical protein